MENRDYIEKERLSVGELFGKSLDVFKDNWLTYLVASITVGILMGAIQGFELLVGANSLYKLMSTIINALASAVISTIYITTAYNGVRQDVLNVGDKVKEKILPMFLTQILLAVLLMIPVILLMMILIPMMFSIGGASATVIMLVVFPVAFFIALKCAFLSQAVVLSDVHYWSAIKSTFSKTSGEMGRLIGIYITPALFALVVYALISTIGLSNMTTNIIIILISSVLGGILSIMVSIATTLLYMEVALPQEQIGETLIYGADY